MGKNLKLRVKVEFVETESEPSANRHPEEQVDGSFSLVLPQADELNISALDRAALDVSFPALRKLRSDIDQAQRISRLAPIDRLKQWYRDRQELFHKRQYNHSEI